MESGKLLRRYQQVRELTERLCEPLAQEDYVVQAASYASPPKWHLAHTSWFFEALVLTPNVDGYRVFDPDFDYLFNSYYNALGDRVPQDARGLRSRPLVADVYKYRHHVDTAMAGLLAAAETDEGASELIERTILGLNHEQQHQELLVTDIKALLHQPPVYPRYGAQTSPEPQSDKPGWREFSGGESLLGADGDVFCYDNERPRHRTWLRPFKLATLSVTNAHYLQFIEDNGYNRSELWLSDGWNTATKHGWRAPLYWSQQDNQWMHFTLSGRRPLDLHAPVCHVSFYEAAAFSAWAGARLPTEAEWEHAASETHGDEPAGTMLDSGDLQPLAANAASMIGNVWEWTQSAYAPYPGYRQPEGALGEYNGKFMINQMVCRGGSCATPRDHIRPTYRNFFYPDMRWQFTGIRLADDA